MKDQKTPLQIIGAIFGGLAALAAFYLMLWSLAEFIQTVFAP